MSIVRIRVARGEESVVLEWRCTDSAEVLADRIENAKSLRTWDDKVLLHFADLPEEAFVRVPVDAIVAVTEEREQEEESREQALGSALRTGT